MKFILLTSVGFASEGNIVLNTDAIESMVYYEYGGKPCTKITVIGDSTRFFLVDEHVNEILELIKRQVM